MDDDDSDSDRLSLDEWQADAPLLGADTSVIIGSGHEFETTPPKLNPWPIIVIARTPRAISVVACVGVFLWVLSGMVIMVPGTWLAEEIICRRHYYGHHAAAGSKAGRDEWRSSCKTEEVQSSLAWLFGLIFSIDIAVSLVVALPYGALADRARKPAYLLAAAGQAANIAWSLLVLRFPRALPVELLLVGPLLALVGGGLTMAIVILYAIISDVTTPENRARTYFFASLAANLAVFIGPPLASFLIEICSPWVPLYLSLAITILAGSVILAIPETVAPATTTTTHDKGTHSLSAIRTNLNLLFHDSTNLLRTTLSHRPLSLLLLSFALAAPLSSAATGPLFLQYHSRRFGSSVEDVGYILAIRGGLTILVVGAVLPLLSSVILPLAGFRRDLWLARASAVAVAIGYLLLGAGSSSVAGVAVLALGAGLGPLCRALVAGLVTPEMTSRVFTVVTVVEGLGSLPAGPVLAAAFSAGMRRGGMWQGLPFFMVGGLALAVLGVLCLLSDTADESGAGEGRDAEGPMLLDNV